MTTIFGKDASAEETIANFSQALTELGLHIEFTQSLSATNNIYSVIAVDPRHPAITSNGKGSSLIAAKASALGEMLERVLLQAHFDNYYLGKEVSQSAPARFHDEKWFTYPQALYAKDEHVDLNKCIIYDYYYYIFQKFQPQLTFAEFCKVYSELLVSMNVAPTILDNLPLLTKQELAMPAGLFNQELLAYYHLDIVYPLTDYITANVDRGICAIPFTYENLGLEAEQATSKQQPVYIPVRFVESVYCTNGLCAGNSPCEAKVQGLSEILERVVRKFLYRKYFALVPDATSCVHGERKYCTDTPLLQVTDDLELNAILSSIDENFPRSLPEIPRELIAQRYPHLEKIIQKIEKARTGIHKYVLSCLDGSLGGLLPVTVVVLQVANTSQYKISVGAHPNMGIALERTLTEMFQGVTIQNPEFHELDGLIFGDDSGDEDNYDDDMEEEEEDYEDYPEDEDATVLNGNVGILETNNIFDPRARQIFADGNNFIRNYVDDSANVLESFFTEQTAFSFVDWSFEDNNTTAQYEHLVKILRRLGKDLLCYDASYKNVYAYRLIVPSFSEIYPPNEIHYLLADFRNISVVQDYLHFNQLNKDELYQFLLKERHPIYSFDMDRFPDRIGLQPLQKEDYKVQLDPYLAQLLAIGNQQPPYNNISNELAMLEAKDKNDKRKLNWNDKWIWRLVTNQNTTSADLQQIPFTELKCIDDNFSNFPSQQTLMNMYRRMLKTCQNMHKGS